MNKTRQSRLKIIPIGGLEQIGMNITAFEYEDSIIVVDCGLAFPEDDMLGIDLGSSKPRIYLGKARADLWLANTNRAGNELNTRYRAVDMEDRVITGVFKDGPKENIVVFVLEFS